MKTSVMLLLALLLTGCGAPFYSAKTEASLVLPDGKSITYTSTKEQQGFDATYNPKTGEFRVHADKSGTAEAAIAAALQAQLKLTEMLQQLMPLVEKAALGAGS